MSGGRALDSWGLEYFHMTDFHARKGPYEQWPEKKREPRLARLYSIINRNATAAIGYTMARKDFELLSPKALAAVKSHYCILAHGCMLAALEAAVQYGFTRLEYVFDDGFRGGKGNVLTLYDRMKQTRMREFFRISPTSTVCPRNPRKVAGLPWFSSLSVVRPHWSCESSWGLYSRNSDLMFSSLVPVGEPWSLVESVTYAALTPKFCPRGPGDRGSWVSGLGFEDKRDFLPLQAADIVAYEIYKRLPVQLGITAGKPRIYTMGRIHELPCFLRYFTRKEIGFFEACSADSPEDFESILNSKKGA